MVTGGTAELSEGATALPAKGNNVVGCSTKSVSITIPILLEFG
jgi:hypothetical protein